MFCLRGKGGSTRIFYETSEEGLKSYRGNLIRKEFITVMKQCITYCGKLEVISTWKKIYVQHSTTSERFIGSCEFGLMTHNSKASPFLWYFGRRGSSTRGRCGGTELKKSVVCCNRFQDQLATMFVFLLLKCKHSLISLMWKLSILKYFLKTENNQIGFGNLWKLKKLCHCRLSFPPHHLIQPIS